MSVCLIKGERLRRKKFLGEFDAREMADRFINITRESTLEKSSWSSSSDMSDELFFYFFEMCVLK